MTKLRTLTQNDMDCDAMLAWKDDVDDHITSLLGRADALEENDFSGLASRVLSLETWRSSKSASIADVSFTVSSSSIDILGIQVPTAAAFTGHTNAIDALKEKVNAIILTLRTREIIAT